MAGEEAKKAMPAAPEAEKDVAVEKAVVIPPPPKEKKNPPADDSKALVVVESEC